MLSDLALAAAIYGGAFGADVVTTRRALDRCQSCVETGPPINTGQPATAIVVATALTLLDHRLSKNSDSYSSGFKWGMRVGVLVVVGNVAYRNSRR